MLDIKTCDIDGVLILLPKVFFDERGYFFETFQYSRYKSMGVPCDFVQENESMSAKNIVRGLHFQRNPHAQGKLLRVINGAIFDVAVDIRKGSPTYGKYVSIILSSENKKQFYIPEGFAHGFLSLTDNTIINYKCTSYYNKESEGALKWDDPDIDIEWPTFDVVTSQKDLNLAVPFKNFDSCFSY